jgi:uncharacterized protein YjbJ (UPF0337 family)
MISLQRLRSLLLTLSLAALLSISMTFGFDSEKSWAGAAARSTQSVDESQLQFVAMNRVEAMAKNIEGKAQEAKGNFTGDPTDQVMGKAKQIESQTRNAAADMEDKVKLKGRAKAVAKNLEGKAQAARGKATGDRSDQVSGSAKQAESQARNLVEDVKDKFQDIRN